MKNTQHYHDTVQSIKEQVFRTFVGKEETVQSVLIAFFGGLSALIEDIPGVGKTTLAKSLAAATGLDFGRIQFTPDLLPGDIVGMTIWSQEKRDFVFKEGSIMHQFILADEINRASARTQSALLEAMQEEAVTVDGTTYPLPKPFFVIATQNPSQYAGTFQLPEAQLDRFGLSFTIGFPDSEREMKILDKFHVNDPFSVVDSVTSPEEILLLRQAVQDVRVDPKVKTYLTQLSSATRQSKHLRLGMSPRATLHLLIAAKGMAFLNKRDYVIPEDAVSVTQPVLQHRLILSPEARMENRTVGEVISGLVKSIPLPTGIQ